MEDLQMAVEHINLKGTPKAKYLLKLIAAHTRDKQYTALEKALEERAKALKIRFSNTF